MTPATPDSISAPLLRCLFNFKIWLKFQNFFFWLAALSSIIKTIFHQQKSRSFRSSFLFLALPWYFGRDRRINCQSERIRNSLLHFLHPSCRWWVERVESAPFVLSEWARDARFNWFEFNSCEQRKTGTARFVPGFVVKCFRCKWVFWALFRAPKGGVKGERRRRTFELLIYAFAQTTNFRYVPRCTGHKSQISRNRFLSFSFLFAGVWCEIMCTSPRLTLSHFARLPCSTWWIHVKKSSATYFLILLLQHNILVLMLHWILPCPEKEAGPRQTTKQDKRGNGNIVVCKLWRQL